MDCCRVPAADPLECKDKVKCEDQVSEYFKGYISTGVVKSDLDRTTDKKVTVLRDSGSCQSCILESSLPEDFVKKDCDFVLLGGFPNTVSSWP